MPPENSVPPMPVNADSLPPIGANQSTLNTNQPTENQQQTPPPNKPFPISKMAAGIGVLIIIIGFAAAGFFLYQKSKSKDSAQNTSEAKTQASPTLESSSSSQQITNSPTETLSADKSWDECKVFPKESDYTTINGKDIDQYVPGQLIKLKPSDGDPDTVWVALKNQYLSYMGKNINGATFKDVRITTFHGNEAILNSAEITDARNGKQKLSGELIQIIKGHNMFLKMSWDTNGDLNSEAQKLYDSSFKYLCH